MLKGLEVLHRQIQKAQIFIFDMDGVLVDLELLNQRIYSDTLRKYHKKELTDRDYVLYFAGRKTADAFEVYLQTEGVKDYDTSFLIHYFRQQKRHTL